ncbi:MAG: PAS domain S-box protein [Bacteroidia bacterium]|nr:PAS domain S-box protein [Bacteroidia bacterium]
MNNNKQSYEELLTYVKELENKLKLYEEQFKQDEQLKKVEQALREKEEKYRLMVENTSDLLVKIDRNGIFKFVSPSYCEKFGTDETELIGKRIPCIINGDNKKADKIFENLLEPPYSSSFEHKAMTKEGERWLAWSFKAIVEEDGSVSSFVGVGRDITKNKEAEAALQSRERFYVNHAFCNILAYTQEELLGSNISSIVYKNDMEIYQKETAKRKFGEHSVYELKLIKKTGKPLHVLVSASPLMNEKGELYETMAIVVDISKLKETEEKLKEADKLKSTFLANMSHEIRNPMNGIIGFADLLRFPDLTEDQKNEYIDLITSSCNVLLRLIEDIIDISKIEAGQVIIKNSETPLNELMQNLYKQFVEKKAQVNKEHINLIVKQEIINENFTIITDPFRLQQILTNLLENAIKFTKKGSIEFGFTFSNPETLLFYVKDTGIGIPADKLQIIFDRFRQVDEESAIRKYGGAGLGLTISKSLAELLNGKMGVESELGKGTVFYFTIPYIKGKGHDIHWLKDSTYSRECDFSGKTVLIAEDEYVNFLFFQNVLKNTSTELIWAHDGYEAIEICRKNSKIDLLLLDIKMPKLSGYEVISHIRKFNKNIPIIV